MPSKKKIDQKKVFTKKIKRQIILISTILTLSIIGYFLLIKTPPSISIHERQLNIVSTNKLVDEAIFHIAFSRCNRHTITLNKKKNKLSKKSKKALKKADLIISMNTKQTETIYKKQEKRKKDKRLIILSKEMKQKNDHYYLDPKIWQQALEIIEKKLIELDKTNRAFYTKNKYIYTLRLNETHKEIKRLIKQIPPNKRLVVTNTNALNMFLKTYNLTPQILPINAHPTHNIIIKIAKKLKQKKINTIFALENGNKTSLLSIKKAAKKIDHTISLKNLHIYPSEKYPHSHSYINLSIKNAIILNTNLNK
ncbi:MAG: metal ABC transporter substrate-binding protein [bacterium]